MAATQAGTAEDSRAFWTTLALGALVPILAIALADFFRIDLASELHLRIDTALLGVIATAPPFAFLLWIMRSRSPSLVAFREAQMEFFRMIGFAFTPLRILLLSLAAGVGEELLFRGVFQIVGERHFGIIAAIIVPNLLFGALHARSLFYATAAALVGTYLGLIFWISGSLAVAIIAHTLYDLLALEWTRRLLRRQRISDASER